MDEQTVIDRITEVENLTDNLEDDDANWLINWGIGQARTLLPSLKDEDAAAEKLDALMAVMRKLNEIAPDLAAMEPTAFGSAVEELATLYHEVFGGMQPPTVNDQAFVAEDIKQQSPQEAMEYLLGLVASATLTEKSNAKSTTQAADKTTHSAAKPVKTNAKKSNGAPAVKDKKLKD